VAAGGRRRNGEANSLKTEQPNAKVAKDAREMNESSLHPLRPLRPLRSAVEVKAEGDNECT
jgi:hypothetical protein